jgi:hypothetical protein
MIDDMVRASGDPESRKKFQIYSGHDTTIAVLLNTLGVFDNLHPPYGAMVLVELRLMESDNYIVTVSPLYAANTQLNERRLIRFQHGSGGGGGSGGAGEHLQKHGLQRSLEGGITARFGITAA